MLTIRLLASMLVGGYLQPSKFGGVVCAGMQWHLLWAAAGGAAGDRLSDLDESKTLRFSASLRHCTYQMLGFWSWVL